MSFNILITILNGAAEELRLRLARRMNITGLLGSIQR
jgi:hypothetical protein